MPLRDVGFHAGDRGGGTIQIPKIVTEEALGAVRLADGEQRWIATENLEGHGRASITVREVAASDVPPDLRTEPHDFGDPEGARVLRALLAALASRGGRADPVNLALYAAEAAAITFLVWLAFAELIGIPLP